MQKKIREARGITLVALVITVIILLILAGVALSLVIGENGLIAKSKQGVEKYKDKTKEEQWQLEDFEAGIEEISLAELEDEEKHPELKAMELVLEITEDNMKMYLPVDRYSDDYKYDFRIDWGDETENNQVTNENVKTTTHTYANSGTYTISIEGICESLYMGYNEKLIKIKQWGATGLKEVSLSGNKKLIEIATPSKNSFINIENFNRTFSECISLTNIPEQLFANCPNAAEFFGTFSECSSLTNIPERLFANCINATYFGRTFEGCTGLTSIPERLFANCRKVISFENTFSSCSNLTDIPERLFANCSNAKYFGAIFSECDKITSIPEKLFANCNNMEDIYSGFSGCGSLKNIPEKLFANCPKIYSFQYIFEGCTSLTNIPEKLFANCPNVVDFAGVFLRCTSLINIPKNLFANCLKVEQFGYAFAYCTNLTGQSIQLWNEEIRQEKEITSNSGGEACYAGCEKLDDYADIPDYWKFDSGPR